MLSSEGLLHIKTWAVRTVFLLRFYYYFTRFYYLFVCLLFWKDNFMNCAQHRSRSLLSFHMSTGKFKNTSWLCLFCCSSIVGGPYNGTACISPLHSRTQWWFSLGLSLTIWKAIISSYKAGNFLTFCHFSSVFINLSLPALSYPLQPLHSELLLCIPGGETKELQLWHCSLCVTL